MQFELLVKPFLYKMMGHGFKPIQIKTKLAKTIVRKKTERLEAFAVFFNEKNYAVPIKQHNSGHITSLAEAEGFISMDIGISEIKEGDEVNVRPI